MEKFNELYLDFLNFISHNFPSYKKYALYDSPNQYINDFAKNILPYMEDISVKNEDVFVYKYIDAELIKGLKFKRVIEKCNSMRNGKQILNAIWNQLHSLYILSYSNCNITDVAKKINNDASLRNLENHNIIIENIISSGKISIPKEKKTKLEKTNKIEKKENEAEEEEKEDENKNQANPFDGTLIGNLAKEISEEINVNDLGDMKSPTDLMSALLGGGENNGISNIMSTVCQKLDKKMKNGELDQNKMFEEAQNMMGELFNNQQGMEQMMSQMTGGNRKKIKRKKKKFNRRK